MRGNLPGAATPCGFLPALFYGFCPGSSEGNCENRIHNSSMEADDFRRSPPCRRSCATRIPPGPANGNSAGISQRLSPDCLFTMPMFFMIPDCHRQKYRHCRVYRSIKTSHKPSPAPVSRTANSQARLDVFTVTTCYFCILQAWLLRYLQQNPLLGAVPGCVPFLVLKARLAAEIPDQP